jgi:hypothetical protein
MPYNGAGSYAAPASTFNPAVTSTPINSTDWIALLADVSTALSLCVLKDGQQTPTANIPMGGFKLTGLAAAGVQGDALRYEQLFTTSAVTLLGAMNWVKGADIASAATINLTTATGNAVHVTGTVTITAVTLGSGMWRLVIFDAALTLTHHATNNNLPGAANITTAAGDRALYFADGTSVYCVDFVRAAASAGIPQNSQSAAYTTVLADAGKHILHPTADNSARVFTIDSNANVPYLIGTAITFVNEINTVTIAITTDTLTWSADNSTGSRTLAAGGMATALKITSTKWVISGSGIS